MRLAWNEDKTKLRATQGHSLVVTDESSLYEKVIPKECIHGTFRSSFASILADGLNKAGRTHIHFVESLDNKSGIRENCEILLYIDIKAALGRGHEFVRSENCVILSKGPFEKELISKAIDRKTGAELWRCNSAKNLKPSSDSSTSNRRSYKSRSGDSEYSSMFSSVGPHSGSHRAPLASERFDDRKQVEKVKTMLYGMKREKREGAILKLLKKVNKLSASKNDIIAAADYVRRNPFEDFSSAESLSDAFWESDSDTSKDSKEEKYCFDLMIEFHGLQVAEWLHARKEAKIKNIEAAAKRIPVEMTTVQKLARFLEVHGEHGYDYAKNSLYRRVQNTKLSREDFEQGMLLYNRWQRRKVLNLDLLTEYLLWYHRTTG